MNSVNKFCHLRRPVALRGQRAKITNFCIYRNKRMVRATLGFCHRKWWEQPWQKRKHVPPCSASAQMDASDDAEYLGDLLEISERHVLRCTVAVRPDLAGRYIQHLDIADSVYWKISTRFTITLWVWYPSSAEEVQVIRWQNKLHEPVYLSRPPETLSSRCIICDKYQTHYYLDKTARLLRLCNIFVRFVLSFIRLGPCFEKGYRRSIQKHLNHSREKRFSRLCVWKSLWYSHKCEHYREAKANAHLLSFVLTNKSATNFYKNRKMKINALSATGFAH